MFPSSEFQVVQQDCLVRTLDVKLKKIVYHKMGNEILANIIFSFVPKLYVAQIYIQHLRFLTKKIIPGF